MTEKQKQAITILNNLQWNNSIKEDDYFLLLEFIIGDDKQQITYIPFVQTEPQPLSPVYGELGKVTCDQYDIKTSLTRKEE